MTDIEKEEYESYIKTERIRESEIKTAHSDGFIEAEKKLKPLIEQAQKREEQAQQEKELAQKREEKERKEKEQTLTNSIIALYKKGFSAKEIADALNQKLNMVIAIIEKDC